MKKNLVIFYPSFEKGGVTKILENLIKYNDNMNIHIITSKKFLKKKNIHIHKYSNKFSLWKIPQRFNTSLNAMIKLYNLLKELNKNTIVHSMQSNIAAIIVCVILKKKIVIRNSENPIYSTLYSENIFFSSIVFILKLIFYNFADGIITNSKGSANSLKYFVFSKKKIFPIYNPYLKKINKSNYKKKNIVINIARLRKQKDHKTLLKAFKIFSNTHKNYKLIVLGHGNLENKLKDLTLKLNLNKKVEFKGWVNNSTKYLKFSKIFVLSSIYEGLGNVLIDAINLNVPCISTDCHSGPKEILLNGKGGYLAKVKSHNDLADKMIQSIKNYKISLKKNSFAKKKLSRFLIKNNSQIYFNYLNKFFKNDN